jgi:hypothetical protein
MVLCMEIFAFSKVSLKVISNIISIKYFSLILKRIIFFNPNAYVYASKCDKGLPDLLSEPM